MAKIVSGSHEPRLPPAARADNEKIHAIDRLMLLQIVNVAGNVDIRPALQDRQEPRTRSGTKVGCVNRYVSVNNFPFRLALVELGLASGVGWLKQTVTVVQMDLENEELHGSC